MPSYVKFLKEIISNRRHLKEYEIVALTQECTTTIKNKLLTKLNYPGSFTIPCSISGIDVWKALWDLGASIILMPLSAFMRLRIDDARTTTDRFQLVDRSIKHS